MKRRDTAVAPVALIMPTLFVLCYFVFFPDPPLSRVFYGLSRAFFILLPLLWVMVADKQPFPRPRFKTDGMRAGIISGLVIGIAAISLYANVFQDILPLAKVHEKAGQLGFGGAVFPLFALFIIIANSTIEEYYWRWFGFSKLRVVMRPWPAILASALGFAAHHVVILAIFFGWPCGLFFGFSVGVGGGLWCWLYKRYDSIWPGWVSHAIIDAAVMLIAFDMLFCR